MAFVDYIMHLFASPFQKQQAPTTTTPTSAAVPILNLKSSIVERDNITHENFQATQTSPSLLTLVLGVVLPIILTSTIVSWYALENVMNGKDKAEKKKRKKSQGGPARSTVEHDTVPPPRDDNNAGGRNPRSSNDSKIDKTPDDPSRCSETGKLKPSIPIPKPFPVPWLPIFIPPLDAADDVAANHNRQGSTDPAPNRPHPSTAILRLLGKTRYFIPQLDEQVVGPRMVRQSLADWELALRASGVGGPALPRPLPIMSSRMRDAFVYCDFCELTWLVGEDDCHGSGGHRVRHPTHYAYGGPDRLKKKRHSHQPDKPLGSLVVHVAAGFPSKAPKVSKNGVPAEIEARTAISFGRDSQYNLVDTFKVLNVASSKEIAELLAVTHALELIASEVLPDRRAMLIQHRADKRATTMKKDMDNERRYAEERRNETMGRIRRVVFKTMDRVKMSDAKMFDVERAQFDDLVREMLYPQDLLKEPNLRRPITRKNVEIILAAIERRVKLTKPLFSSSEWDIILDHFLPRFEILCKRLDTYHNGLIKAATEQLRKMACDLLLKNKMKLEEIDAWCELNGDGPGRNLRDLVALCMTFESNPTGEANMYKSDIVNELAHDEALVVSMLTCAVREALGPMAWEHHSKYDVVREFMVKNRDNHTSTPHVATCFMRDMWLDPIKGGKMAMKGDDGDSDGSLDTKASLTTSSDNKPIVDVVPKAQKAPSVGQTFMTHIRKGVAALTMSSLSSPPLEGQGKDARRTCSAPPRAEGSVTRGKPEGDGDDAQSGRVHAKTPGRRMPGLRIIMVTDSQDMVDSICKHQDDWTIHFRPGGHGDKRLESIPQVKNRHGEPVGNRMDWLRLWASVANLNVLHNVNVCWYAVPRAMNAEAVALLAAEPKEGHEWAHTRTQHAIGRLPVFKVMEKTRIYRFKVFKDSAKHTPNVHKIQGPMPVTPEKKKIQSAVEPKDKLRCPRWSGQHAGLLPLPLLPHPPGAHTSRQPCNALRCPFCVISDFTVASRPDQRCCAASNRAKQWKRRGRAVSGKGGPSINSNSRSLHCPTITNEDPGSLDPPRKPIKKRIRKPRGRGLRTKTGCHCATSNRDCVWPDIQAIDTVATSAAAAPQLSSPTAGSVDGHSDRPPTSHSSVIPSAASQSMYSHLPSSYQKARSHSQSQDGDARGSYGSMGSSSHNSSPSAGIGYSPDSAPTRPSLPPPGPVAPTLDYNFPNGPIPDSHNIVDPALAAMYPNMRPKPQIPEPYPTHRQRKSTSVSTASPRIADLIIDTTQTIQHSPKSPETVTSDGMLSAGVASTRWLDLLAGDAEEADSGFSLGRRNSKSQLPPHTLNDGMRRLSQERMGPGASRSGLRISNSRCGVMGRLDWDIPERYPWQEATDMELTSNEAALFRAFAERSALWLDIFDPWKHFSTYAVRLAMRNVGLMKAILALQARYASIAQQMTANQDPRPGDHHREMFITANVDPTDAVQYYHEALHYVSTALQYHSYAHSEELLGTALVISTYEMLDAFNSAVPHELNSAVSNWQRHLKGVFWIQRSQDVNGASGGLRQSVWWAWLRQDLWAAFREGRRCLSFWRPVVDYPNLTQCELADRAVYLLSQAVNYCAESGPDKDKDRPDLVVRRAERGEELMEMLERWKSFLGDGFRPLLTAPGTSLSPMSHHDHLTSASSVGALSTGSLALRSPAEGGPSHGWQPIWIHPPQFAAAMQVYSFAKILVTLNRPATGDFDDHTRAEILSESAATICGIAMELKDQSCQIMSAKCLFGAGLCVQRQVEQDTIISLIQACEARTGWPMATLQKELRKEWRRGDVEMRDV
ncbi:hypothetical protein PpBr36_07610 [Pyricularia pennisetigena]|uniref:hypothetical protein n=1 Tax=Pyricularia pennisetigena TaxID=1578925 RepID=UPI0011538FF6|nr:hypothetical protein PpBr36_07610 [Pyricularia pennisetigena]TLS25666.1 hypothetical protein PpBr36_07610 [Pyricularia pennisetigena]